MTAVKAERYAVLLTYADLCKADQTDPVIVTIQTDVKNEIGKWVRDSKSHLKLKTNDISKEDAYQTSRNRQLYLNGMHDKIIPYTWQGQPYKQLNELPNTKPRVDNLSRNSETKLPDGTLTYNDVIQSETWPFTKAFLLKAAKTKSLEQIVCAKHKSNKQQCKKEALCKYNWRDWRNTEEQLNKLEMVIHMARLKKHYPKNYAG
jgi:hypothetical protein